MFKLILSTLYALRAGSWKLKYEEQQINRCVLWANQDNCGCCDIDLPKFDENLGDDYYLPYFL
jgi:hypothetical protein